MKSYDKTNKIQNKLNEVIQQKDDEIAKLTKENEKLKLKNDELRKEKFDAGLGKGEINRLKSVINDLQRDIATLKNKVKKLEGNEILAHFSNEQKRLIKNIRNLSYPKWPDIDALATKFQLGLDNVIQVAYKIKLNSISDRDYYTYLFRDDIVALLEKILSVLTNTIDSSASFYLLNLINGKVKLPPRFYKAVPLMEDKKVLEHILWLVNLESKGYHGSKEKDKRIFVDEETNEKKKYINFFNLSNEEKLTTIFTMLEFIYAVFVDKDQETYLQAVSSCWYKTL